MTAYILEFELMGLPPMTNVASGGSRHWRSGHTATRKWKDMVGYAVMGKKPKAPLPKAALTLTRFSSTEPDYDGLVSGFKSIIDALREHGVLVNDKIQNIGVPKYLWVKAPMKQGRILVRVKGEA